MTNLILSDSRTDFTTLASKQAAYIQKSLQGSANTQRAYQSDLKQFKAYCEVMHVSYLPATVETLASYVTGLADRLKYATITRHIAAISKLHTISNLDNPADHKQFKILLDGIKRTKGVRQKQAPAFTIEKFKEVIERIDTTSLTGLRNKAILLCGFTGAFRRSELAALNVEHLRFEEDCLVISLDRSKTNPYGEAEEKAIFFSPNPTWCPVRTLQKWITTMGRTSGPLFVSIKKGSRITEERLTDKSINNFVKDYLGNGYSAHSMRASFVTVAKKNGAADSEIMRQTKHKSTAMIARYTRIEEVKQHNAGMKLGL